MSGNVFLNQEILSQVFQSKFRVAGKPIEDHFRWQEGGKPTEDHLRRIDRAFLELEQTQSQYSADVLMHYVACLVHLLVVVMHTALGNGMSRNSIRKQIPNVWRIHGESSFGKHVQEWPRGYAGDFEVVDMIVDRVEKKAANTVSGALGRLALNSEITQQHREKLRKQAEEVAKVCRKHREPNIMSIACGSSRDLETVQEEIKDSQAKVWLIDQDKGALGSSLKRLSSIHDQVKTFNSDVKDLRSFFGSLKDQGLSFSLIYAGGLFDYLSDEFIESLISMLTPLISTGGGERPYCLTTLRKTTPISRGLKSQPGGSCGKEKDIQWKSFLN